MNNKKVLIFNGSTRKNGTSNSFALALKKLVEETGNDAEIIHVIDYLEARKSFEELKTLIEGSSIIGVVSPLYVDSLPYPVIWFFERLASDYKSELKGKGFFAIGQSAFPYVKAMEPLIGCCSCFAEAAGMKWLGGLGYGGGVILNGAPLETLGKKGEKITKAFKFALEDILECRTISIKAQQLLTADFPKFISRPIAAFLNHSIKKSARKDGVTDLERKYYLEER